MARPSGRPLRQELIDAACAMIQAVGVNAFSYGDLAKQLDISAPSIHHHFQTKADLVGEVTAQYRQDFAANREAINDAQASQRIRSYAALFAETSAQELMCICGSVAGDWATVSASARTEVVHFFDEQVEWLTEQLDAGVASKELRFSGEAREIAIAILAALEGALLLARSSGETLLPSSVSETLLKLVLDRDGA